MDVLNDEHGGANMYVEVYLEEKNPQVKELESVISYNDQREEIKNHQELIDGTPFFYSDLIEVKEEIRAYVAEKLDVDIDIVQIMN